MSEWQKTHVMPTEIRLDEALVLRPLVPEDAGDMFSIIKADPEIGRSVTWPAVVHDPEATRSRIEKLLQEDKFPYTLVKDGTPIGFSGSWASEGNTREMGFSYFLAKNMRGHGYITRAIDWMMQVAQTNNPIDTFVVNIIDTNSSSQAVAANLGFEATDMVREEKVLRALIRRWERPAHE